MSILTNLAILKDMMNTQGKISSMSIEEIEQKIDLWSKSLELNLRINNKSDEDKAINNDSIKIKVIDDKVLIGILNHDILLLHDRLRHMMNYIKYLEKTNKTLTFLLLTVSIFCLIKCFI